MTTANSNDQRVERSDERGPGGLQGEDRGAALASAALRFAGVQRGFGARLQRGEFAVDRVERGLLRQRPREERGQSGEDRGKAKDVRRPRGFGVASAERGGGKEQRLRLNAPGNCDGR